MYAISTDLLRRLSFPKDDGWTAIMTRPWPPTHTIHHGKIIAWNVIASRWNCIACKRQRNYATRRGGRSRRSLPYLKCIAPISGVRDSSRRGFRADISGLAFAVRSGNASRFSIRSDDRWRKQRERLRKNTARWLYVMLIIAKKFALANGFRGNQCRSDLFRYPWQESYQSNNNKYK